VRAWLAFLVQGRALALALALGLGSAAASLADQLSNLAVGVLAEHAGRYPDEDNTVLGLLDLFSSPYYLYFTVGGTVVVYGFVLSAALALSLLVVAALLIVRRADRELRSCPFCAARIPHDTARCAICGSSLAPNP
jgi:large-conductance mechanosensitive channel